jgi:hypothetical protein
LRSTTNASVRSVAYTAGALTRAAVLQLCQATRDGVLTLVYNLLTAHAFISVCLSFVGTLGLLKFAVELQRYGEYYLIRNSKETWI